jgi:PPK2 family polyphosphate:nucleotide phosphotransferase
MARTEFRKRGERVSLDRIPTEPPKGIHKEKARARFAALGEELFELQDALWGAKVNSVMVVLQGRDTAGKDGTIKHVAGCLNPRGVQVVSFGAPTSEERQHDFLWRVHRHAPRHGEFSIFNRSHYEDVLVVRVHGLAPKDIWKQRYAHIEAFERLLAAEGTLVLKYFLHISRKEQKKRLLEREGDVHAAWKLSANDWRERDRWDDYTAAYEDAISVTAAPQAPWIVVPADAKWYRNLVVAESIVETLRQYRKPWQRRLEDMGRQARAAIADYRAEGKARSTAQGKRR